MRAASDSMAARFRQGGLDLDAVAGVAKVGGSGPVVCCSGLGGALRSIRIEAEPRSAWRMEGNARLPCLLKHW